MLFPTLARTVALSLALSPLAGDVASPVPTSHEPRGHVSFVAETSRAPWQQWAISFEGRRPLDIYVARATDRRAPLVMVVQGSACYPLFRVGEEEGRQRFQTTLPAGIEERVHNGPTSVHFAAVERPGLCSFDGGDPRHEPRFCTEERGGITKQERVKDVADAALALAGEPWVSGIVLVGHSEGGDVVAGAARLLGSERVLAVALLAGGGPTQFFDFVAQARRERDARAAQAVFDELLALDSGGRTASGYRGHPIERIFSYAIDSTPLDDLVAVNVPVFIAQGTDDAHVALESADLLALELLRRRPLRAVSYLIAEGLDHGFCNSNDDDYSGVVLDRFLSWALGAKPERTVLTWKPPPSAVIVRYLGVRDVVWAWICATMLCMGTLFAVRRHRRRGKTHQKDPN